MKWNIQPQGDRALQVIFGKELSEEANRQALSLCRALDESGISGFVGAVPAYCTLLVEYDPLTLTCQQATELLQNLSMAHDRGPQGRLVEIPVCYGGDFGPDLPDVARHTGLTPQEVIDRHSGRSYRVYMLGFRPGFPYLGGMDPALATPRRTTPRLKIQAGSVGIAAEQTGIYPEESPGGWNLIGRTPLSLFREDAGALLSPGDTLRFVPITPEEFETLEQQGGKRP